jgi:hypothetical protein
VTSTTMMQSSADEEFVSLTDEEIIGRYFEKDFFYDTLAGLTDSELDDWIDDYISHLPETHNLRKEDVPRMLGTKLKQLIRDRI